MFIWILRGFRQIRRKYRTAYLEYRSWVDNGDKAIFLPGGGGYIIKTGSDPKDKKVRVLQVKLSPAQQESIGAAFARNKFDGVPQEVVSNCTDGTDMFYYRAGKSGYHKVHQYMKENAALNAVRSDLLRIITEAGHGKTEEVPVTAMVQALKTEMKRFKEGSSQNLCVADILNKVVRALVGAQQLDYQFAKQFMLKDKYW